ncbi:MAG: cbb3-type cytochrome c oxidase subunit II [Candidatus Rokuibacteriota bacterium]
MGSARTLALVAGFAFVTLAMFVQGVLPTLVPEARTARVSRAVRTELGEIKWVRYDAADYTPPERRGRDVYVREGCWYCHSQYVRPVAGESFRWGPVSEAGEYAFDQPHLFGTRRIGPDLTRVGGKYGDDWHYAHLWEPRLTAPESIMPALPWLFETVDAPYRPGASGPELEPTAEVRRFFTMRADRPVTLFVNDAGVAFVRPARDGFPVDGTPVLDTATLRGGSDRPAGTPRSVVRLLAPTPDAVALVRYLQKLGASRGAWRDAFEPQAVAGGPLRVPDSDAFRALGREVYRAHCVGCHGGRGDGAGPAATFLFPRPRDFTAGVFKFHSTPSGTLPTDGDLFRTITRGVRGTAMPAWHEVTERERLAVVAYIKTFSKRWREEAVEPPRSTGAPPAATPEMLARGRQLYTRAKCAECHGDEGRGDGPSAATLRDDVDAPIRPSDFTRGQLKGGASVADVYRAMTVGLSGTPMPSFADSMTDDERWAISWYVLSFSAWTDPLTGERLRLSPAARAALESPEVRAHSPAHAFDPDAPVGAAAGRPRRYYPGVSE